MMPARYARRRNRRQSPFWRALRARTFSVPLLPPIYECPAPPPPESCNIRLARAGGGRRGCGAALGPG
eukprot:3645938-Pyramimonas_sp.AAC.1